MHDTLNEPKTNPHSIHCNDAKSRWLLTGTQQWEEGGRCDWHTCSIIRLSRFRPRLRYSAWVTWPHGPNWQFLWEGLGLWQWTSFMEKWKRDYISPHLSKLSAPNRRQFTDIHTQTQTSSKHVSDRQTHSFLWLSVIVISDTHSCSLSDTYRHT